VIASATRIWGANGKRYATWTNDQRRVIQFRVGSDQGVKSIWPLSSYISVGLRLNRRTNLFEP